MRQSHTSIIWRKRFQYLSMASFGEVNDLVVMSEKLGWSYED